MNRLVRAARARAIAVAISMAMTAGVTTLAPALAFADDPGSPSPAAAPPVPAGAHDFSGLNLRQPGPRALSLDKTESPKPLVAALKVLVVGVVIGAGLWMWKRKQGGGSPMHPASSLTVLRRSSLGVRSELVLIEVDGQRLLLGVTPSSIQTLATLTTVDDEDEATATEPDAHVPARMAVDRPSPVPREREGRRAPAATIVGPSTGAPVVGPALGDRFAEMLDAASRGPAPVRREAESRPRPEPREREPRVDFSGGGFGGARASGSITEAETREERGDAAPRRPRAAAGLPLVTPLPPAPPPTPVPEATVERVAAEVTRAPETAFAAQPMPKIASEPRDMFVDRRPPRDPREAREMRAREASWHDDGDVEGQIRGLLQLGGGGGTGGSSRE